MANGELGRARASRKRQVAEANARARAARSPLDQLRRLDAMLGAGVGAVRERARLAALARTARGPEVPAA